MHDKLLAVQQEIGAIKKDSKNPYFNSNYFDINSLLAQVKPILNKKNLLLMQPLSHEGSYLTLKTILFDCSTGDKIEYETILPDGGDAQKQGSAITYFRRYALQSLLALEAEDDDANSASGKKPKKAVAEPTEPPVLGEDFNV